MRRNLSLLCSTGLLLLLLPSVAFAGAAGPAGQVIAKYGPDDVFRIDADGDFVWSGVSGGDAIALVAPGQPTGVPLIGDDGELCKTFASQVYCDRNKNGMWDGGGPMKPDFSTNFASKAGTGIFFFADTNGNGVKELIKYMPGLNPDQFLVDDDEDGVWEGSTVDRVIVVAPGAGAGVPFACDCDGDMDVELGKYVDASHFVDLNNDGNWDGNANGDLTKVFAPGQGTLGFFVFGRIGGAARDVMVRYIPDVKQAGSQDLFLIDANRAGTPVPYVWDGGTNDAQGVLAPAAINAIPDTIDIDGMGTAVLLKTRPATSEVFADKNGNLAWDGAPTDVSATFAHGGGAGADGIFVVHTP